MDSAKTAPRIPWPAVPTAELERAYEHCLDLASTHYENFPTASRLLPASMRPHVAAIYAFARAADDFADEARFEGEDRLALLDDWQRRLRSCADVPAAGDPIFLALGRTLSEHRLPLEPFEDLLSAFRMDVTTTSHATWNDLLGYCRLSANPVGRLMLLLFGHGDDRLFAMSDAICTALQLTNFWQDAGVDADKNRCYLPQEDLRFYGVEWESIRAKRFSPAFADLLRYEIRRTRALFDRGDDLPGSVSGRLGFQLRVVLGGGRRTLDKIEESGCDVFARRPKLVTSDWAGILLRAAAPVSRTKGPAA